jgi:hypothetical protein
VRPAAVKPKDAIIIRFSLSYFKASGKPFYPEFFTRISSSTAKHFKRPLQSQINTTQAGLRTFFTDAHVDKRIACVFQIYSKSAACYTARKYTNSTLTISYAPITKPFKLHVKKLAANGLKL